MPLVAGIVFFARSWLLIEAHREDLSEFLGNWCVLSCFRANHHRPEKRMKADPEIRRMSLVYSAGCTF